MQIQLKFALICVVILYILVILKAVKNKNMRIGYLVFWLVTGIILIIALLIPDLIENISNHLGFEMPINMIFSAAIFVILALIFNLTELISKLENKNTMLIQEISILKKKIQDLENKK